MKMRDRMKFFMLTAFVAAVLALAGCSEDSTTEPQPSENKSTGFVVNVQTPSLSHFVQYFETLPTGTVDISSGKDFQRFFPVDIYDGAFFMANPNEEQEFSKVVVNADGEVVVESGFTVGTDAPFQIAIRDSAFGVFHDRSTSQVIGTFDPRTMTKTGNIDMGAGQLPGTGASRYQSFYFKENFLYAPVRPEVGGNYDSLGIHVADLSSGTYVKTILFSTKGSPSNDFGQNDLDEAGNLYIPDSGNPLIFPPAPAVLNRINAGSTDIDPTYVFPLGFVLNQTNIFPTFGGFRYISGGRAIALVSTETPQAVIDTVTAAGGFGNLTNEQLNAILQIFFTAENASWSIVDVNARSVTPIPGLPKLSAFSSGVVCEFEGKLLLPIANTTEQAIYSYDLMTGMVQKEFDVTGGSLVGVYNIANDKNRLVE